jgi:hypothetical protein
LLFTIFEGFGLLPGSIIMKNLTEEEFKDRTMAILRARKIFIKSGITDNITLAFELYQKVCAEREREIFLSPRYGGKIPTIMDKYSRPKCPDCNMDMMFRVIPQNEEGIKTQLVCSSDICDTVLNSENDLGWWMQKLRKKDIPEKKPEEVKEAEQNVRRRTVTRFKEREQERRYTRYGRRVP